MHTGQLQGRSGTGSFTSASSDELQEALRAAGRLDPNVRPPPFTGAIPSASFLRRSTSVCTIFPRPSARSLDAFGSVFARDVMGGGDERLDLSFPEPPACAFPTGLVVKVDPDATGTSQASSPSDEMSMMSIVGPLDPLEVLPPSKLKSSWNCFQEFRAPSFCSRSVVCSEASSTCRRSASVSGTSTNSTSSSEPSSSLDGICVADVDGLVSANKIVRGQWQRCDARPTLCFALQCK